MFVSNLDIIEKNPHLQLNEGIVNEYIDGTNILNVNKTKDIPFVNGVEKYTRLVIRMNLRGE